MENVKLIWQDQVYNVHKTILSDSLSEVFGCTKLHKKGSKNLLFVSL